MEILQNYVEYVLRNAGFENNGLLYSKAIALFGILLFTAFIAFLIAKQIIVRLLSPLFSRTTSIWDDIFVKYKVLDKIAHIVPAIIINLFAPDVFSDFEQLSSFIYKATDAYIAVVGVMIVLSFLNGLESVLSILAVFKDKPLASYFQLIRIVVYIASAILILSILAGKSPVYFLSAFGAMTAILLLIFKDTILGLVASVQISSNDIVRVGDWIEMPKYNADGDVLAINLNTVKIKNWDKTVTSVPTFYFITDSFKNWRGMQESGGRRIKRSLFINLRSVKFVDKTMREKFERFHLIKEFVAERQMEIEKYNAEHGVDPGELINGRRMTNIGVFRRYIQAFLKNHKGINQNMTMLVRQLQPDGNGIPLEIYCFTSSVAWAKYEETQSDIFDHLFAAASHFELEVFQNLSGSDISQIGEKLVPAFNMR